MPEILKKYQVEDEVKDKDDHVNELHVNELKEKHNVEFIGNGAEAIIVALSGEHGQEKVVAFNYMDLKPEDAKAVFYLHRIFSTLFPHNFPHFYASAPEGTIRKRVVNLASDEQRLFGVASHPFIDVIDACREMKIRLYTDNSSVNFLHGADGGEYYVDTLKPDHNQSLYRHKDRIIDYMREKQYTASDIYIVEQSLDRLRELSQTGNI